MAEHEGMLDKRLVAYAIEIIRLTQAMPKTMAGTVIAKQVLRSGTSAGANYREAKGAESRADFVHKLQVVIKELRETDYWLTLARESHLLPAAQLDDALRECSELTAMAVRSVVTVKRNMAHGKSE